MILVLIVARKQFVRGLLSRGISQRGFFVIALVALGGRL